MEQSKFDQLIYFVKESDLDPDTILKKIIDLFPLYDPTDDCYNDKHLTPFVTDKYKYNRSLGLPVVEAIQAIGVSVTLMKKVFEGERISLERLVDLARIEVFALSEMKVTHIGMLEKDNKMSSNIVFLEKVFAESYGNRKQIDLTTGFGEDIKTAKAGWTVTVHKPGVEDKEELPN